MHLLDTSHSHSALAMYSFIHSSTIIHLCIYLTTDTPDQSAYLKGHSTQTSLHRVIDDWLDNINEDQITGVCQSQGSIHGKNWLRNNSKY